MPAPRPRTHSCPAGRRRAAALPLRPGAGPLPPRGSAGRGPGYPRSLGRASRRAFRRRPRERGGGQRLWVRGGPGMERGGAGGHRTEPAPHSEPRPMLPTYRQHPPSWRAREGPAPAPAGVWGASGVSAAERGERSGAEPGGRPRSLGNGGGWGGLRAPRRGRGGDGANPAQHTHTQAKKEKKKIAQKSTPGSESSGFRRRGAQWFGSRRVSWGRRCLHGEPSRSEEAERNPGSASQGDTSVAAVTAGAAPRPPASVWACRVLFGVCAPAHWGLK